MEAIDSVPSSAADFPVPQNRVFSRPVELLLYAASPAATLLTAPLLARALGPEVRGQYGVAMAVVAFALTISAWGQGETLLKEARRGRVNLRVQARLTSVGGLLATVAATATAVALGVSVPIALAAAVFLPILNQAVIWRAWAVSQGELKLPAVYNSVSALARVILLVVAAAVGVLDGLSAMVISQASLALTAIVTIGLFAQRTARKVNGEVSASELLRTGGAVIVFDLFNALTIRSDLLILPLTVSDHEVGLYAAPASLTTAALAVSLPFKSRTQMLAISGASISRLLRELGLLLGLGLVGVICVFASAGPVVRLAFGPEYQGSVAILKLLAIATIGLVACDVAQGTLVVVSGRRDLVLVGALSAALVVVALVVLCPLLGAQGAATALVIGYSSSAVLGWSMVALRTRRPRA